MRQLLRNLALVALMCVPWVTQGQQTLPYTMDFENETEYGNWTTINTHSANSGSRFGRLTSAKKDGDYGFSFSSWSSSSDGYDQYLISPELTGTTTGITIAFDHKKSSTSSTSEPFKVGYSTTTNDVSAFTWGTQNESGNSWDTYEETLPANTKYVAIFYCQTASKYQLYIDNITLTTPPTCFKPTLADNPFSNITATGATITWTPDTRTTEPSGGWEIRYRVSGSSGDYTIVTAAGDATSKALTDLSANTSYEVSVRAHCDGDDYSDWTAAKTFKTLCNPSSTFPYEENFDSYTGSTSGSTNNLPACWNYINTTTYSYYIGYPIVYNSSSNAYSPNNYLYFFSYYSSWSSDYDPQDQYAILPPMENLAGKQITLQAKGYNTSSTFKIGLMTNPSDPATFTPIATQTGLTTSYQEFTYNIPSNTTAQCVAIMIEAAGSSRTTNGVYIDDIVIDNPPSCSKPTDVTVSNITANGARISWSSINDATATYTITDGNAINVTTNPGVSYYDFTTLTANTAYGPFTLTANCGESDHSEAAAVSGFKTKCNPVSTLPYTEDFESYETTATYSETDGIVPDCWSVYTTGSVKPHVIGGGSSYYYKHSGTKALTFYGSGYCYAALPEFAAALNTLQISFWYQQENASNGTLTLGYITDEDVNMSTFTPIVSYDGVAAMTQAPTTYLNEVPATATRLVFRWYYSSQYSCCIDDIEVKEMSSCMPVTSLLAPEESITSSSIALTWTDNNNGSATYIITDGEDNAIPAAQIENLTTTGVTITGLTANTAYSFKVKADCGGGEYSDAVSINNVKTACGTETIPFTENFDSYAASTYSSAVTPDCWKMLPEPTNYYNGPCVYSGGVSSSRCLYTYGSSAHNYVAVLPEMSAATNTLQVRFQYKGNNTSYTNRLEVGYVTDVADTTTFVSLWSVSAQNSSFTDAEVTLENAPAGARIAFRNNTSYGVYIDNITVETIPACKNVTAVTAATNVTSNSATLSWTDTRNTGATYTIYNKATEPATILGTTTEAGVTTINLTGLTAHTTYNQLVVVANCSENEHSGEVSVPSFTTKRNECAITGVTVTAPAGVTRGDVVFNAENHSVTIPVYYLTAEEIAALTGTITKSTGATIYAYNATTSDWTTQVYSLAGIRDDLAMNTPYTVRVVAEDPAFYQDWTITLQGEDCSTPRNLTFAAERTSLTANWVNADPAAEDYQVVISPSALDEEGLAAAVKTAVNGATTYTFTGLLRETEYHVYVRTNCGNDTYSGWTSGTVTTKGLTFCEDVTVVEGSTTNANIPLRPYYLDSYNQHTQLIYTATDMAELEGMQITSMTFYTGFNYTFDETPAVVKLGSTTLDNLTDAYASTDGMTTVSNALINIAGNKWVITFDAPYTYTGGNLLIDITTTDNDECSGSTANFLGRTATANVSRYMSGSSNTAGTASTYQPKVSFTYCASVEACPAVAEIEVSDITETGATVTWTASAGDYVSSYQVIKSAVELDAAALEAYAGPYAYEGTALTCDLTGLTAYTDYYVYVRAYCGAPDNVNSTWQSATFRTLSACGAVTNLAVNQNSKTTVVATWTKTKEAQANNFNYILSTDEYDVETQGDDLNVLTPTGSGITDLTVTLNVDPATHYYLYVQNYCEGEGSSPWKSVDFTTYDAMPAVVNITATQITHTAIAATWQKNVAQFANETQWQVAAVEHGDTPENDAWIAVNDTHYTFVGLTPETSYDLYVRPYQANPEAIGTAAHLDEVTTEAEPGNCAQVGNGSTTANLLYTSYGNTYSQQIYTAAELQNLGYTGGTITSLSFNYTGTSSSYSKTQSVYIGTTTLNAFNGNAATDFVDAEDMTLVYGPTLNEYASGWREYTLSTPFVWDGESNIVVGMLSNSSQSSATGWSSQGTNVSVNRSVCRYRDNSNIDINDLANTTSYGAISTNRPNIKLCFVPVTCRAVTNLAVSNITTDSAIVSWMPGNTEVEWVYNLLDANLSEPTANDYYPTTTPYIINDGLQTDHDYRFWVRPVMEDEPCGNWKSIEFSTAASCGMPTVLPADGITATTATLHALAHPTIGTAEDYTFRYWKAGDEESKTLVNPSTENSATLTGLTPNTTYWYDVMVSCTGDAGGSRWSEPKSFITDYQNFTLPYTTDFAASRDNEWRMVNGTHDNKWCIGEATGNPARSMYISNNGGVTNAYNNSGYCIVYAYAGFNNFEAAKQYTVEFDWKSNGESGNYDFIRAWIVPDNAVFEANTDDDYPADMSAATGNPTGWISLDNKTPLKYVNDWQHKKAYVTVPADGAYKIVFMWHQDNSVGTNPPAAIDNVSIVESEKYDITINVTKTIENVAMGADPTAEVNDEPLASLTDIYENTTVTLTAGDPIYGYEFVNWTDNNGNPKGSGKFVYLTLKSDTVLNANYDSATFTITAVADDVEHGTAYGTATVKFNLPVMLTARPNTGYHFVNWTSLVDGVPVVAVEPTVEDTIIVNAYRDSAFTAHFDTNEYHVTVYGTYDVVNNNAEMGTVTGPSTIKHFKNADYVPTANYGYHFVNWTDAFDNVLPVKEGTENTLNIAAVSDTTVYANFDYNVYSVIGESANTIMGNVTGSDEVNYHSTVTLTATPEEGYHFVNWTENNVVMGTNATINVFADSNRTLIAHFDTNVYHVTINVNNTTMGSVSGPATVKHFKNADYEATENTGYHFVNWTNMAGTEIGAEAILNIAPVSDTTVNANFAVNTYALTVNVAAECTGMGTVSGSNAAAEHFQNYQISATPATGYHFAGWADLAPTDPNYTANPRTVTLTKDSTFTASFDTNVYVLTVVSANETMGSVEGSVATAKHFVNYEISAEANYGYHFTGWNDNNTDNPRTVTLTENKTYTANFTYNPYTVSGVSADPTMGNVSGSATVNYLTPVTLTATPNYGYVFVKWEEADTVYSTNATIDVVANAARTLKAYFAKDMFTVTASVAAGCETMGAVAPESTTAEYMTPVTLTATPAEGYHLVSWSNGATTEQITVLADTNRALVATFAINKYDITVRYDATRGSVTDAQSHIVADSTVFSGVEHGTVLNFTATVAEGSRFAGWNDGTTTVTTENIAYTATATKTLTANFIDAGKFQVTLNYNDVMGTVTGDGEHHADSTVTITATPNYGYHFVAWVQGTDSIFTPSHTFTMPQGEVEYTAVFDFNQYTLTVVSADTNMGKVTGTATVNYLTNVPVNATNKYGYHFTHWYGNGINDTVATTANATIQVLRDSTVTANFDYNQYIVTAVSADENTGSVSGTDTVNYLSNVTLTATPAAGYHFVNWTNAAGAEVCTTATYVVQATENATYTANFATTPAQLAWSAESFTGYSFIDFNNWAPTLQNPNNVEVRYGVVETGTMVNAETGVIGVPATYGNIVSITGTYHIYAVHETSQQYYYDSVVYTLTVENGTLIALSKNISDGGTVSFPDYTQESTLAYHYADENMMAFIAHGTTVRAQATPATGFNFVEWRSGNDMASYDSLTTNNPVTYTVPDEAAAGLKAIFDTIVYNVTVVANPVEGSVEGPATVKHFLSGTYTATATPCYHFVNWTDADGAILGTTSTYTLNEPTANVELHANFALNSYAGDTTVNVCDAFTWHDSTYTVTPATNPTYVYKTVNNCDSTVTLHLTIRHSNTGDTTAVACNSFEWYGVTYNTTPAVAPTHEFTNVAGCDSIVTLHLTVNHSNTGDTTAVACNSFTWYGVTYTSTPAVAPTHEFTNVAGCDSIVTLHLTVNHSNTGDTTAVACNSFTWYGVTYTSTPAVAPTHEFTNVAGCDSTVTLHLTINHSNTGDTTAVACDSFTWYGVTYTSTPAVAPTHQFTNVAGCDSIVTLNLTINHSNTGDTTAVACDSFTWYGVTYTSTPAVAPTHEFTNVAGCDSIVTLHLTINHSNTGDTNAVACDSFDWYEHTNITASTETLTHVFTNVAGCDSTVTLHLTVNHSNTGDTNAVACDSLFWNGEWRVESGEYNRTLSNVAGCDSIVTLHLTINHSQTVALDPVSAYDSYEWNDETYTESGLLTFTTEGANGCDSTTTVMLTILHYDSITVILTVNDATMGTTDPVAGTYRFYPGDAVTATATANDGHHFVGWAVSNGMVGDTLSEAQLSYEFLPEMAGMTLYVEAVFAQDAVGIENVDYSNINIFSADNKVYVKGAEGMTIYIYDVNGRCMANRANAADTETFTLNMTGVVLVKAGNAPAKRVVLVR